MIDAVGPYAALKAALPSNATLADHSGLPDRPGLHRHPYPLCADRHHRRPKAASCSSGSRPIPTSPSRRFADEGGGATIPRASFCDELLRSTAPPPRWCSARCMPGSVVRCSSQARRGATLRRHRRQGADGPQRPPQRCSIPPNWATTIVESADRQVARPRPRSIYAITPRFAGSSTAGEQLEDGGRTVA